MVFIPEIVFGGQKMKKKILAGVIAICLAFGSAALLPENTFTESTNISASAESTATSGKCGKNVNWTLDKGVLTISGTGPMYDYSYYDKSDFESRDDIHSVVIKSGVSSVGERAFSECSLNSITISDSVKSIGDYAFSGCSNLENMNVPSGVTKIGQEAFRNTKWLANKQNENALVIVNGILIDGNSASGDVEIPDGVKTINIGAFCNSYITGVNIPSSVTNIGDEAFKDCYTIKSINIPGSVETIGEGAFRSCSDLESVTISDGVKSIGNMAFYSSEKLRSVTIPQSVTSIGYSAFAYTKWLEDKQKENPLVIVGSIVLDGKKCTGDVVIPSGAKIIADGAFSNNKDIKSVVIPDGVTSIGYCAFYESGVEDVTVPKSVTNIGQYAFEGTEWFWKAFGDTDYAIINGIMIAGYVLYDNVSIPEGVTCINERVFDSRKNSLIVSLTLPSSLKIIKDEAFFECPFESVNIPNGVTSIGDSAFARCPEIETVTIPSSVTHIGDEAFPGGITICGTKGTEAERYAKANGFTFKEITTTRLAGNNRYDTASKISQAGFDKSTDVILASGENYADALAAVPFASSSRNYNQPILLTKKDSLPDETLAEIKRLGAKSVTILGGEGAVSETVENKLKKEGLETSRIAGKNRFETATLLAYAFANYRFRGPKDVFFVYYNNYADALAAGAAAAAKNAPILYLKTNGEIDAETEKVLNFFKGWGSVENAYVIGGEGVISNEMADKAAKALGLEKATRIAGKDRFETNLEVNKKFAGDMHGNMVCAATGMDFPDALSGGVYAAINKAPIILVNSKAKTSKLSDDQTAYLKMKAAGNIVAFGGTGVVSDEYLEEIAQCSK